MVGGGTTVNTRELLAMPPTVTTTGPLVDAGGTGTAIYEVVHSVGLATVPLNVTVLVP
jgi:hypothetical protein